MYTQCPECLSVFSLDAQTLAKAHGHVVCGHCNASFGSLATLTEQLPPEPFVELPDGEIFYVITNGRNNMGAYGPNVTVEDRWAIVAYLRALQLARLARIRA